MLAAVALLCSFGVGASVRIASADDTHVTCVLHGLVNGSSPTDGSYFARVYAGCGSSLRACGIYSYGVLRGSQTINDTTSTCNAWSQTFGNYTECAGSAGLANPGVFSEHSHGPTSC